MTEKQSPNYPAKQSQANGQKINKAVAALKDVGINKLCIWYTFKKTNLTNSEPSQVFKRLFFVSGEEINIHSWKSPLLFKEPTQYLAQKVGLLFLRTQRAICQYFFLFIMGYAHENRVRRRRWTLF